MREISQETGFNVEVKKLISERTHPQFDVHIRYYKCELAPGKIRPIQDVHEIETVKWADPSELKELMETDIDPGVAKYLKI